MGRLESSGLYGGFGGECRLRRNTTWPPKLKLNGTCWWRWLGPFMHWTDGQLLLAGWLGVTNFLTLLLFAYDKWQAGRRGSRVAELTLCLFSALGGWAGGMAGILVFRHKSAKGTFQLKFAAAFAVWAGLLWAAWTSGIGR